MEKVRWFPGPGCAYCIVGTLALSERAAALLSSRLQRSLSNGVFRLPPYAVRASRAWEDHPGGGAVKRRNCGIPDFTAPLSYVLGCRTAGYVIY